MQSNEIRVALALSFLDAYSNLPKGIQKKTMEFIKKFKDNPRSSGINYENINNATSENLKSVRIDKAYRGIVYKPDKGNIYTLVWADHHDEAYDWAVSKKCEVNEFTGTLQIYDVVESFCNDENSETSLFHGYSTPDLLKIGVPVDLLDLLRSISDSSGFLKVSKHFPSDIIVGLQYLIDGATIDDVVDLLGLNNSTLTTDNKFYIIDEIEENDLANILESPLDKWRLFLHPKQVELVQKKANGPMKIMGGAGTGKTVVGMHRAKWLASRIPKESKDKILFTTFTTYLAQDIKASLTKLCSAEELSRIEIVNIDQWLSTYLKKIKYNRRVIYQNDVLKYINESMYELGLQRKYDSDFLLDEWNMVFCPSNIQEREEYFVVPRIGRGTRLNRLQKSEIFDIFQKFQELTSNNRVFDVESAKNLIADLIESKYSEGLFKHIVIDEAQDLSMPTYRLLKSMVKKDSENNITIIGDTRQRIYQNRVTLRQCGINVVGRSYLLGINYRTTDTINSFAEKILLNEEYDDLDGDELSVLPSKSLIIGDEPIIKQCENYEEELNEITKHIDFLRSKGVADSSMCIALRTNNLVYQYRLGLKEKGYRVVEVVADLADEEINDGIRIATMHRIKGLEFEHVILPSLNDDTLPLRHRIDNIDNEIDKKIFIKGEKSLLYVAITRAKFSLMITFLKKPSGFLNINF
jgi:superfamily I DNA/RNA helicase/mRNA-degrading endonuclease RelE of RelBE toxin-antitoxin system